MDIAQLPKNLTLAQARDLREAFGRFYDLDDNSKAIYKSTDFKGKSGLYFSDVTKYIDYLDTELGIPQKTSVKQIGITLESWYEQLQKGSRTTTELPEYKEQTQTTWSEEKGQEEYEKFEEKERLRQQSEAEVNESVRTAIAKQQELQKQKESLQKDEQALRQNIERTKQFKDVFKDKVVYATITLPEIPPTDPKEMEAFEILKSFAQGDETTREKLLVTLSEGIEAKITPSLTGVMDQTTIHRRAELTAKDIILRLNPHPVDPKIPQPMPFGPQYAVYTKLLEDEKTIATISPDQKAREEVKREILQWVAMSTEKKTNAEIARNLLGNYAGYQLYQVLPEEPEVEFTEQRTQFSNVLRIENLNEYALKIQEEQLNTIEYLKDFTPETARSFFLDQARGRLDKEIAKLPQKSLVKRGYNDAVIQDIMSRYGLGRPINWEGTNAASNFLMKNTDYAPYVSAVSRITGIYLGVQAVRVIPLTFGMGGITPANIVGIEAISLAKPPFAYGTTIYKYVPLSAAARQTLLKAGGQLASKGAGQAVGQATAQVATKAGGGLMGKILVGLGLSGVTLNPIVGFIGGILGGELVARGFSKLKQWWTKNKDSLAPTLAVGGALMMIFGGGPLRAVGTVAAFTFGGIAIAGGGLAAIGAGVIGVGNAFRLAFITLIAPTLIATIVGSFVGLILLTSLIMFVINSGAYIVPPNPVAESGFGPGGLGFPITCTNEKSPVSFDNNTNSPIARRAWQITSDLYQGFWCFWNRSPGDLPTDVTTYAPSYPELFNMDLFIRVPNPTRDEVSSCGECLFWCTWLVQKAYRENGNNIQYTLWSPTMQSDFTSRGKFIDASQVTPSRILPGSVIFFDVNNSLARTDHVGIAHTMNSDGIYFVQSNAGTKDSFIPFNSNGVGLQDIPGINVLGIGLP